MVLRLLISAAASTRRSVVEDDGGTAVRTDITSLPPGPTSAETPSVYAEVESASGANRGSESRSTAAVPGPKKTFVPPPPTAHLRGLRPKLGITLTTLEGDSGKVMRIIPTGVRIRPKGSAMIDVPFGMPVTYEGVKYRLDRPLR